MSTRTATMIRGLADQAVERGICAPTHTWEDCDSGDMYEAATTKDGEWMVVTRVSSTRDELITCYVPREALEHIVHQLGGKLDR